MSVVPLSNRWWRSLLLGAVAVVAFTSCDSLPWERRVTYAEAREVVDQRCVECHSEQNTNRAFPIAPQSVKLDTAAQMKQYARRIQVRVVEESTMPIVNMSGMTDEERALLGRWVKTGAKIP